MKSWNIAHSLHGFEVVVIEVPAWRRALMRAAEHLPGTGRSVTMWRLLNLAAAIEDRGSTELARIPVDDQLGERLWGDDVHYWKTEEADQ